MMNEERPPRPSGRGKRRPKFEKIRPELETVDTDWRLFIAVPLPDSVQQQVQDLVDHLKPNDWPMRWVGADNAHITLHFLGDTPPEEAELLRLALGPVIAQHPAFDLRTAGLGVFPKLKRPRVLWLGVWGPAHRLESLYNDVGDTLDSLEFPIEEKPFSPHITLGRVRSGQNVRIRDLPEALRTATEETAASGLADPKNGRPFTIDEIHLMRSHLGPNGPQYEIIERFPLAPPEDAS